MEYPIKNILVWFFVPKQVPDLLKNFEKRLFRAVLPGVCERQEQSESVGIGQNGFGGAFRVRHHTEYIAGGIADTGDIARSTVGV